MKSLRSLSMPLLIVCLAVATGCRHNLAEVPADADLTQAQQAFDEATRSFEAGDYAAAEEQFLSPKIWSVDSPPLQLQALKFLAFSYCVTERPNQCRFAFERAVQTNPSFRLERAEAGHPMWGPVFEEAVGR
ncbi:TssQ family T6SS-associated lipoprotein [Pseudomonas nitroreducens]|uniref:TssQ family T6SS-associated lipoprotein n=1 Tax=Pseudomonas nitroreducens TaxID=46680 RepID=UPI0020A02838|nr:TssQ family T6SS-associated lipoprotein [Pseudomonas nitroreducens]MCP1622539.1 outer membrane protein assembly factor BamD (BamD/ComL family) [Pseudomonas nitroreducens]